MAADPYGLGRVVGERGVLPQRARKLDASLALREDELSIDVESLNIDAASFRQLEKEAGGDERRILTQIRTIVAERGKMQNPVTGSGGMLIGKVREIGPAHPARGTLEVGDRIATLVSLSLTPLVIDGILAIHPKIDRVDVQGRAILFATGLYAKLPTDMTDALALAALDVCGAPALVARYAKPGMRIGVLGAGKSGALCLAQARRSLAGQGELIAIDLFPEPLARLQGMGLCDQTVAVDATQAVEVLEAVTSATGGALCDLMVNCASVGNTEMATVLSVREGGTAIFFSMATSFTAATLGAEGVGKDVAMVMGNGYVPGHAQLTLDLLRSEPKLRAFFEQRYV